MKLQGVKEIKTEDFSEDIRPAMSKVAEAFNPFAKDIESILEKRIDFDNLAMQYITLVTKVNSSGIPVLNSQIKTNLTTQVKGVICIRAVNDSGTFPTSSPWVSFSTEGNLITINHISGLPANVSFTLSLLIM